jgi:hypothetical protein
LGIENKAKSTKKKLDKDTLTAQINSSLSFVVPKNIMFLVGLSTRTCQVKENVSMHLLMKDQQLTM